MLFLAADLGPLWVRLTTPPTVALQPCEERRICLPLQPRCFNDHPSGRGPYVSASHLRLAFSGGTGIFNPFAIAYAFRPRLRSRLTLFRLALNRNPWAYGGPVSHRSYRYSCLHFLFQKLHARLTTRLRCRWNAPLPLDRRIDQIRSFGAKLDARKFSMPDRSTSELLRTLSMNGCF